MALKFSISGMRGLVDKDLNPDVVFKYAYSFGRFVKPGSIVIGRDTRQSGKIYCKTVVRALSAAGHPVVDLGIVPTPTVLFMVRRLKAKGGMVITASHNPVQWNALKFVSSKGVFLNETEFTRFSGRIIETEDAKGRKKENVNSYKSALKEHIDAIVEAVEPLGAPFRVGVDAVNGAGSIGLPLLLEEIGCRVFRLNCRFAPVFPRKPEPTKENIVSLSRFVRNRGLDVGFACDPDCDRLAVVDERGRPIGEENTLVLAADYILTHKRGSVVTNLSTTRLMEDIAGKHGVSLYRTRVGEANVVSEMKERAAVIGGEGNGGVIYPKINYTRDAMVGAALIIRMLSERGVRMSQIMDSYPKYHMLKKKVKIGMGDFEERKEAVIDAFDGRLDLSDGLKIIGDRYWIHIRPSQTEDVVRIIGESRDRQQIEDFIARVRGILCPE
ncbi:MAG: phosphoglucosamine mutase [candidate division WOR-3 bacterium]|nr:MAG: phosphoglucosamine mutase [candidate division WOR-3 bacterium]